MPKEARVRTFIESQHVKGSKRLLKSAHQYFHHTLWSIWNQMSLKGSVLVVSEILRLLINILTTDDKYSHSAKGVSNATNSNAIISKSKNIFWIFFCIIRIWIKFGILWKKRRASEVISCWNYRLQNEGLLNYLKILCQNTQPQVMQRGPKDCLNLQCSIFVRFFDLSAREWAPKSLCY